MLTDKELDLLMYHNKHVKRRGDDPEVFYISTLARGAKSEYNRKIDPTQPFNDNFNTLFGTAMGRELAKRFVAKGGYQAEVGVATKVPYEFTLDGKEVKELVIVGYADFYHPLRKEVIELKSTLKDKAEIVKSMKTQVAMYGTLLEEKYHETLEAYVLRIAAKERSAYVLTRDEMQKGAETIIERAKEVADMLDGQETVKR